MKDVPAFSQVLLLRRAWSTSQSFHDTSHIAVTPFLQHPAVAIRVREVGEAGVVPARGIEPGCETSVPGINGYLVPDFADLDPTFEQAAPRSLKVGDDEIDVVK
jgi:hypothetical protein